jgi:hypothetical protein
MYHSRNNYNNYYKNTETLNNRYNTIMMNNRKNNYEKMKKKFKT